RCEVVAAHAIGVDLGLVIVLVADAAQQGVDFFLREKIVGHGRASRYWMTKEVKNTPGACSSVTPAVNGCSSWAEISRLNCCLPSIVVSCEPFLLVSSMSRRLRTSGMCCWTILACASSDSCRVRSTCRNCSAGSGCRLTVKVSRLTKTGGCGGSCLAWAGV